MTTDLVLGRPRSAAPSLLERFVVPPMSAALAQEVKFITHPHADIPPSRWWPRAIVREATRYLEAVNRNGMLDPADEALIEDWLNMVVDAVEFDAPTRAEFLRRVRVIVFASTDIPACAWTLAAKREVCNACKGFPSVARIREFVYPPVEQFLQTIAALKTISAG